MKKPVIFLIALLCGSVLYGQTLDAAIRDGVRYLAGRFPQGTRAAVLAVQSAGPELSGYVERRINTALVNGGWFTVVERNEAALSGIDREMDLQLSGNVSDETSLSIGKQLGAQILVVGAFTPANRGYRLELRALSVETARVGGQYTVEDIAAEAAWASLAAVNTASISFTGVALTDHEKDYLLNALREGLAGQKAALELDDSPAGGAAPWSFVINMTSRSLPPQPPANTALLQGTVSITFAHNGRSLQKAGPYELTEMSLSMLARRASESLARDAAFFRNVSRSVSQ